LIAFPSIFKGEHVNKKVVTLMSGKEITVKFSEPRTVQVDGETILEVSEYTAKL
jgi:diacylglycerol kinase family enzyme